MKLRKLIILCTLLLLPFTFFAQKNEKQDKKELRKEFREFKTKFIANEIDLKDDQYKEFSEIYNQMEAEKRAIMASTKKLENRIKNDKGASDEDYAKVSEAVSQSKLKVAEIDKKYDEKFSKILSKKQIYQMKIAEDKFFHRIREMKGKKTKKRK